jgi:hypothetical protein
MESVESGKSCDLVVTREKSAFRKTRAVRLPHVDGRYAEILEAYLR